MQGIITIIARLIRAAELASTHKWSFLGLFIIAFLGSVALLAAADLLPEAPQVMAPVVTLSSATETPNVVKEVPKILELPTKIEIPVINLLVTVANPESTNVEVLDAELLRGAVRYPTSAKLGQDGNVVLFGHSSYLPVVNNPAYKSFNGIQKLAVGDVVTVYSSATAYTYKVRSVAKESANDAVIPLSVAGKVLTLSTCNSFGEKSDRFVVTADFVESHPISQS
jgi:LPXTG-site transpeptidase (sortase) family protein